MLRWVCLLILLCLCAAPLRAVRLEQDPDYTLYNTVLQSYVSADGLVDYQGLRTNSLADLQTVLKAIERADLRDLSYDEKLAFWINAYNANLIKLILDHPEMQKITDQPGLFDLALPIAKGQYSLNDIEHRVIRGKPNPKTGEGPIKGVTLEIFDPRVHFALCTGTLGGPALQSFAYYSKNLEQSLRQNSSDFVNSPSHLRIVDGRLIISRLMNQYAEDFDGWGGSASYLTRMVDPAKRDDAAELKKRLPTDYRKADFVYDETINDILHAPTKRPKLMRAPK